MISDKLYVGAVAALMAAAALPAWSQGRLAADTLKIYGGNYSTRCGDAGAPQLRVVADALMVESGGKRMSARNVQAAYSYFGNSPPPDFDVVLMGEVKPGLALEFHVYHDRAGRYAKIEADPKVRPALGALVGHKYRHCAAAGAAMAPPAPAPAARAAQEPGMALPIDMLRQPAFKSAYFRALGALARDPWLTVLDGPQNPTSKLRLGGMDFVHGGVCKPHDCADNKITFLYAASAGRVYAKVSMGGRAGLLGNPPQAVAAELERLWRADWPQR